MLCIEKVSRKGSESCSQVRNFPAAKHMTHFPAASPTNQLDRGGTRAQAGFDAEFCRAYSAQIRSTSPRPPGTQFCALHKWGT